MANKQLMLPANRAFNSNGLAIPGATATLYVSGTTTPANFYSDTGLSTSLGPTLTANGAGRFDIAAYQSESTAFRLIVKDAGGSQLDDIDPFYFGRVYSTATVEAATDPLPGVTPQEYGAVADGVTDDAPAFRDMLAALPNYGGLIYLPQGFYRFASRVTVPKSVTIIGAGSGIRSRVYGEPAVTNAWESYTGSVIVCDSGAAGLFFPAQTDVDDTNTVVANEGATASNPTYWQYPGATGSRVVGIALYSQGGTSTTVHGIEHRARCHFENVTVFGFGGEGFLCSASADVSSSGSSYGNASSSTYKACFATQNRGDGFKAIGRDANLVHYDTCRSTLNGGWGYSDLSTYGCKHTDCHAATNNTLSASYPTRGASSDPSVGSYYSSNTNGSVYDNCYAEEGNGAFYNLSANCIIHGGVLSGIGRESGSAVPRISRGNVERGGVLTAQNLNYHGGGYNIAFDVGGQAASTAFAWGTDENGEDLNSFRSHHLRYYSTQKIWSLEDPANSNASYISFPSTRTNVQRHAPGFRNGLFLGALDGSLGSRGPYIGFSDVSPPGDGTYRAHDIILKGPSNSDAMAGGKIGWICTSSGTKASSWVSGTVYFANVFPADASHVTNSGNVYRCTTAGGGTSTVGPTHTSGTVTGADGYAWLYLNDTTVPTFKEWGAIDA
jgi:hypothetical protein